MKLEPRVSCASHNSLPRAKDGKSQKNLKEAKVYKTVKANGGLYAYKALADKEAYTLIPNNTKVELVTASAGTKTIKGKKYTMSKIKYGSATYYVAKAYLK